MKNNMRKWFPNKPSRRAEAKPQGRKPRRCLLETLESRALLTAVGPGVGVGTDIETTGPYGTYMPVGSGPTSYRTESSFGLVDIPASAFTQPAATGYVPVTSGASAVNGLGLELYNTAASGTYGPTAGTFDVYFVPNDTLPTTEFQFQGATSGTDYDPSNTGLSAIGTDIGGVSGGASTLGMDATDLVGSFTVTSTLPSGYSTFNFGSLFTAGGLGSSASLGAGAQAGIESDINNHQDVRLVVVANDTNAKVDWDGNYTGDYPQVSVDITQAPLVNFSASNFTVNEADQVPGNTTTDTITVDRTSNPNTSTTIDYTLSDGSAHAPSAYTATNGSLTFAPGVTSMTFPVVFNDITTTNNTGTVNLTLSQPGTNSPQAIFPSGGTTATATINYLQANSVTLSASSYSVNENAGTATITVNRTGTNLSSPSTVAYATADGIPYATDPTNPDDAEAGRDYTSTSGTLTFAANQTSATITVPITNVTTFAGTRSFSISLSDPSTGTELGATTQSTITITDNTVAGSEDPTGYATYSAGIETTGPYYTNSYIPLVSTPGGSQNYADMPEFEFGPASAAYPTSYAVSAVDSVQLSIYNTAIAGGYGGVPGSFDVYALLDDTTTAPTSGLTYEGGTGNTGASVIGTQAGAVYIGSAQFTNNQVGYNNFVFDNLPASVSSQFASDLSTHSATNPIRFVIVPSAGSAVRNDWEGNNGVDSPEITLLVQPSPAVVETFNVDATSATVNKTAGTETITVDRTSTGDLSDSATVQYATSDGTTGVVGTPYNGAPATAGTDYTAATGTLTFAPGQTQATFTVPLINNPSIYGDKSFTVTISNPATGDPTRLAYSTSPTEVVTIDDPRTTDIYQSASDLSTVESTGPSSNTTYFNIEAAGTHEAFGAADFNDPSVLPYTVPSTIGTINQLSLSTVTAFPPASYQTSGLFNVYLVSDTTTSIDAGTSPLTFNTTDDPIGGLGNQLGTTSLLGTINYSNSQPTDEFTSFPLTNASPAALATLASDLNGGDKFRIVVTPGDTAVAASYEGFYSDTDTGLFEAPIFAINYTPYSALTPAAPVVSTSGSTGQTYTLGGSAVAVDSGISVTSSDTDITGASETIANYQSGDSLNYTPIDGITIASNSGGVLNLTGSATPAQYTAALQSVTFSTTSINQSTRTIDVVADDSAASPTTSNTGVDTVKVAIAPPVVTANQTAKASTAGQTVAVDSAVTVKSFDTDVTGATMTIGTGYQSGSDTLHFTTQNGITGVYSAGVLTLSGSATPAQYQTALQSVTFSSTSTSVATRNISIVVDDSGDTGNVNSNTATTQITVSAPLTVTAAYISSTSWASSFDTYLSSHTNAVTGHAYGSSTLGYAFQTGTSAAQTQTLPWTNLNTITVTFSGPVSGVALGSLKLNGGSGGSTPSVTGFTSDGSNTYSWTLSGPLTNNKYAFGIASTSSSYGPAVVDSHGAGISGTFTTGQALPSGNGLAGSSFDFFFDVLPGDANRDAQDNATDINDIRPLASGTRTTSSSYNPYYDLLGAGQINATTLNTVRALTGRLESAAPTNPNSTQGVGTTGFVGLELGAQETGSSSSSSQASSVSNVVSAPASTTTTTTTTSTTGSGSGGTSSTTGNRDHGRHAATDEVVSDFDLADLWV